MSAVGDRLGGSGCDGVACLGSPEAQALLALGAGVVIALSLLAIVMSVLWLAFRRSAFLGQHGALLWAAGCFVILSSAIRLVDLAGADLSGLLWWTLTKIAIAILGAVIAVLLVRRLARLTRNRGSAVALADADMDGPLRREVAGHETTLRELEATQRDLETRVEQRTHELNLVRARLETALRGAYVHAFSQDRDLHYTWVYDPDGDGADEMLGRTDREILPADVAETVIALKRRVIETGRSESCEVCAVSSRGRALYALHVEPAFGADGGVEGLTGAAIDISRMRSLESEQQRLTDELRGALHRYEIALRGSHVTLFNQDRDLRFTWISNALFGRSVDEIVGRVDAELLPAESREQFGALMRAALASGRAQGGEVSIKEADKTRWYDLHVEPLPGDNGSIAGVTCALFDITERKTSEGHLRLLMRELTHRSKNLLAVIQSMARQTARNAGTIDDFLDAFGDRLQAIATSHDLLVQEGWYGASLNDLTRRQLAKYIDGPADRVALSGPAVHLKPAAAQSFGLALHELAMNAERFGALSVPQGRVEINWRRLPLVEGSGEEGVEIVWTEHGGPDVATPISRGFGSLVVEKNLSRALDAEVALSFDPSGVRCRMLIPASHLLAGR